jgi:hypothetical protein
MALQLPAASSHLRLNYHLLRMGCNDAPRRYEERSEAAIPCLWRNIMRSPRFARDDNLIKIKVVRFARPKGKKCRLIIKLRAWKKV